MPAPLTNSPMFRRLVRRLLFANRGRLFVILLALSAGAAVSAALLNLQTDAKRRLTTEFRSFGPNVIIVPRSEAAPSDLPATLDEKISTRIPEFADGAHAIFASFLYIPVGASLDSKPEKRNSNVLLVGYEGGLPPDDSLLGFVMGTLILPLDKYVPGGKHICLVGAKAASALGLLSQEEVLLRFGASKLTCHPQVLPSRGDSEDYQVIVSLHLAQELSHLPGRVSMVRVIVSGNPQQMQSYLAGLQDRLPEADVRPLRQFSEAQIKIYLRISGLLTAATVLILALTILCVMAAMTNIAAERKHDVGMMKAIGGSARGILNLFLTEAALLGLAGGLIGAAAGIALSIALGKAVFGIAAAPRLIVYPISVALTVIVAIVGAYPLRRLAGVRPATIFRGDA